MNTPPASLEILPPATTAWLQKVVKSIVRKFMENLRTTAEHFETSGATHCLVHIKTQTPMEKENNKFWEDCMQSMLHYYLGKYLVGSSRTEIMTDTDNFTPVCTRHGGHLIVVDMMTKVPQLYP